MKIKQFKLDTIGNKWKVDVVIAAINVALCFCIDIESQQREMCRMAFYVSIGTFLSLVCQLHQRVVKSIVPDSKKQKFQLLYQSSIITLGDLVGFLCLSNNIDIPFAICRAPSELCVDIFTNLEKQNWQKEYPAVCMHLYVCLCMRVWVRISAF